MHHGHDMADDLRHQRNVPEFFIVGQPKCGTTALFQILREHPAIYMPALKEPYFFAPELPAREHPSRTVLPATLDAYLSLFDSATPGQRIGEASVYYLWSREAARRIAEIQPDARIIAILREPASLLRSLHLQLLFDHIETEKDLSRALALEADRRKGRPRLRGRSSFWPQLLLYSDHVRYVDQLRRYDTVFPPEQMLVLIYDDLLADNARLIGQVLRFLGVDETYTIPSTWANPTVRMRSRHLQNVVRSVSVGQGPVSQAAKAAIKAVTPQRVRRHALHVAHNRVILGGPRPPDPRVMAEMRRRLKPEVVALSEYLRRDLVTLWDYNDVPD
jgi:hypothetical protein